MNNINFTGAFYIEKPSAKVWNNIKNELPKHKCIFENINGKGDKFVSFKDCENSYMAHLILKTKVKFKFYPEINLKCRLDSYKPQEAMDTISHQTQVIENRYELLDFVKNSGTKPVTIQKYHWKPNDHVDKTLKAVGLKESECTIKIISGVTFIKDKSGKIIAKASPNNQTGVNFVYVYPKNTDESSRRFALSQSGETYDFGPLQFIEFQKNFMKNVKIDLGRIRPQK